jgi:hypothetical protein
LLDPFEIGEVARGELVGDDHLVSGLDETLDVAAD